MSFVITVMRKGKFYNKHYQRRNTAQTCSFPWMLNYTFGKYFCDCFVIIIKPLYAPRFNRFLIITYALLV